MGFVSTFKDSQIFGGIYFYSYALIIIAILFGALYFATKVTLFHESNQFLQDVTMYLSKCTLSIRELTKKCKKFNETIELENIVDAELKIPNFESLKQHYKGYIRHVFNDIRAVLDKHENYLIDRIDKINVDSKDYLSQNKTLSNKLQRSTETNHSFRLSNGMENLSRDILESNFVLAQCKDIENNYGGGNRNKTTNVKQLAVQVKRDAMKADIEVDDRDVQVHELKRLTTHETPAYKNSCAVARITNLTRPNLIDEMVIDAENKEEEKGQTQIMEVIIDDGYNDEVDLSSVGIQAIKERIDAKYEKYQQISSKQGLKSFFKTFYKIRGLLIPALTHFFDTATDIALVWEFYILKEMNQFDNQDVDIDAFFLLSLGVLMYYRISSAFEVWQFTGNKNETILQFLFDFFLKKLIYVNLFKMKSYQASHIIKQFV